MGVLSVQDRFAPPFGEENESFPESVDVVTKVLVGVENENDVWKWNELT